MRKQLKELDWYQAHSKYLAIHASSHPSNHPSIHPSVQISNEHVLFCLFVQSSMLGCSFEGAELKKMCSQIAYSDIEEIRSLLPQWSLPAKLEYSIILGTGYYLPGDREE